MIAKVVGLDRSVISRNVQNTKISDMHNLLSQGHDMDYIARHYHMDLALVWALRLEGKTDLIFFDPPYFSKKERAYEKKTNAESPSISSYTKEEYESFLEGFFLPAHRKSKAITSMALLNADWRDFESTPASKENPDNSITIYDYHEPSEEPC
jgi:16S rRNA G966 N2-methylase RsmD